MQAKIVSEFVVIATLCIACSTSPVPLNEARDVPKNQFFAKHPPCLEKEGQLSVVRDSGYTGSLCLVNFSVNKKVMATLGTGEKATFCVPAGELVLSYSWTPVERGWCNSTDAINREALIDRGQKKVYRMLNTFDGRIDIERMD